MFRKVPKASKIVFLVTFFTGILISFFLLAPQGSSSIDYIEKDISKELEELDNKISEIEAEKNNLDTADINYTYKEKDLEYYIQDIQAHKKLLVKELDAQKERHQKDLEQFKSFQTTAIIISFFVILIASFIFALIAYWVIKSKPGNGSNAYSIILVILSIISFIIMIIALGNNESDVAICFAIIFGSSLISISTGKKNN